MMSSMKHTESLSMPSTRATMAASLSSQTFNCFANLAKQQPYKLLRPRSSAQMHTFMGTATLNACNTWFEPDRSKRKNKTGCDDCSPRTTCPCEL